MYTIIVVGCGATGSNLITLLSQYAISEKKINNIVLVDGDDVERKNFRNQKFTMKDVNENKARVLSNRYSKLGVDISYIPEYITDTEKLINLIKSYNNVILVGAVDNNAARQHMHKAFYDERIQSLIYIDTGNGDGDNRLGQTICGAKQSGKIVKPPVADIYPQILEPEKEEAKIEYHCSQIDEHPQNFVVNVISATIAFTMINNIVSLGRMKKSFVRFNTDNISVG